MRLEIYFYKNDTEMLLDQGARAVELGAGNDWKVIFSEKIKDDYLAIGNDEIPLPKDKKQVVIIQNNMV